MEHVILVDENDEAIGTMEKMEAHQKGLLHRAFSVFLFNSKGEMLLQKRARSKYHSGGLWTNTCCSHPLPNESIEEAGRRKLNQEMGIDLLPEFLYKFTYKTELDHDLIEHEIDHVLIGQFDGEPKINLNEVEDWAYASVAQLKKDVEINPSNFSAWFQIIIKDPRLTAQHLVAR